MENTIVFSFIIPILFSFISPHLLFHQAYGIDTRQTLEISIGGSSPPYYSDCPDCPPPADPPVCPEPLPPPPPPPCPPPPSPPPPVPRYPPPPHHPPPPPNPEGPLPIELLRAVKVIETFRKTITYDPFKVTGTWNGRICYDRTKYKGFICDTTISDNKLRVAFVKFDGLRLNGKPLALTNFLTGLTDIIVFHANSNNFSGQVPAGIRNIPSLFELDLSNNKLTGKFPPAVLTATNLTFLDLRFNQLIGELPPQVFTLDLDFLYLNNNQFTGTLPETLGKTPALFVTLANNRFTGPIPKTLGENKSQSARTLREILLLNNQLSGCLPYQIGQLKSASVFDASTNKLTGPIPHSFGCLEKIQYLNISDNKLYGSVPEPLCKLGNVVELTLNLNYITQVGPECRKLIAKKKLDVSMNCILDLPLQRSKEECEAFFLKQQSCPDPESFNRIPCKIDYSAAPVKSRRLMAQPRTYAALHNHI